MIGCGQVPGVRGKVQCWNGAKGEAEVNSGVCGDALDRCLAEAEKEGDALEPRASLFVRAVPDLPKGSYCRASFVSAASHQLSKLYTARAVGNLSSLSGGSLRRLASFTGTSVPSAGATAADEAEPLKFAFEWLLDAPRPRVSIAPNGKAGPAFVLDSSIADEAVSVRIPVRQISEAAGKVLRARQDERAAKLKHARIGTLLHEALTSNDVDLIPFRRAPACTGPEALEEGTMIYGGAVHMRDVTGLLISARYDKEKDEVALTVADRKGASFVSRDLDGDGRLNAGTLYQEQYDRLQAELRRLIADPSGYPLPRCKQ